MQLTLNENDVVLDVDMASLFGEIEAFKGEWRACGSLPPKRLAQWQRQAAIESAGASTRIEGGKLSDSAVSRVMAGLSSRSFATRDEQEVAGYACLWNEICDSWRAMPLTESLVKRMHATLLRFSDKDARHRGAWKTIENNVAAFDASGRQIGVVLETAPASETPRLMTELIEWVNLKLSEGRTPPLLVVGMFVAAFLAIHPFQDGNGRLSRALSQLMLLRAGYAFVPYESLDSVIEATKQSYYISLRATQRTLQDERPNWSIWLTYFLKVLARLVRKLKAKVEDEHRLRTMPETSMRIIELSRDHGAISIAEAEAALRINKYTLRDHFRRLVEEEHLVRVGSGRATKYKLKA